MDITKGKVLEITDKPIFDEYFKIYPPEISELTFTNLFIWRYYYNFYFLEWKDHILVFSKDYLKKNKVPISNNPDTLFFLPPIGPTPETIISDLFTSLKHLEIHRVPESLVEGLRRVNEDRNGTIQWIEDRNNWDYVYERPKLDSLSGRKLYRKRRWLKRFLENYPDYEFHLLSEEWLEACMKLQIEWCDMNECRLHEDLVEEHKAINEAFSQYSELKYRGGLIMVEGKCIAYTLGELLNSNTVVIHIEKALSNIEGSYQAINQNFVKNCCEDIRYVNREQDIGDPGLRQAKETYVPHHMVEKSIIYRADS